VITVVFKDRVPVNIARQLVNEKIKAVESEIPAVMEFLNSLRQLQGLVKFTSIPLLWKMDRKINSAPWICEPFRIGSSNVNYSVCRE
jgi:hypothetical protein